MSSNASTTARKSAPAKVAAPKVRENKQPNTEHALKLRSSESYQRVVDGHSKLGSQWRIAWVREGYAMLKTGAKGEWATICTHGKVQRVEKGALAEKAGRNRAVWCTSCASAVAKAA